MVGSFLSIFLFLFLCLSVTASICLYLCLAVSFSYPPWPPYNSSRGHGAILADEMGWVKPYRASDIGAGPALEHVLQHGLVGLGQHPRLLQPLHTQEKRGKQNIRLS